MNKYQKLYLSRNKLSNKVNENERYLQNENDGYKSIN